MKVVLAAVALAAAVAVARCDTAPYGSRQGRLQPTQLLKSYQGFVNDFVRTNDAYRLEYHVGDSSRFEQRSESGEVKGSYAFVAPEGDEYEFKYEANADGYNVAGDALPKAPEETDDVKAARDAFFEAYEKQVELTKDYEYDSDESDEDGESSEESSEEESSEEESSEEDSDEDSDEDEEEEEEEEEGQENDKKKRAAALTKEQTIGKNSKIAQLGNSFFNIPSLSSRKN